MFNIKGGPDFDRLLGGIFCKAQFNVDVEEFDSHYLVEAELPGIGKENISIEYKDDILSIHANDNIEAKDERHKYMMRSFTIPSIDYQKAEAKYCEGLLTINLPKKATIDKSHLINII